MPKRSGKRDVKHGYSSKPRKRKAWNKGKKMEKPSEPVPSTSSKKLINVEYPSTESRGYRLFHLDLLCESIQNFTCCKECKGEVEFKEVSLVGLGGEYQFSCKNCKLKKQFSSSTKMGQRNRTYEANPKLLLAMRLIGNGYAAAKTFCGLMDLPRPITLKNYRAMEQKVLEAADEVAASSMQNAIEEEIAVTEVNQERRGQENIAEDSMEIDSESDNQERRGQKNIAEDSMEIDSDSESDNQGDRREPEDDIQVRKIKIKGDGTWQRKGHSSLNGAVIAVANTTNKVVDTEVMTTFCKPCQQWEKNNGQPSGSLWDEWYREHKSQCLKNHTGSAGGMESAGMLRIFMRSIEKYNVKYTYYVGDGDAKTFNTIQNAYGDDFQVNKLECIGHVGKRFGYHMRKHKMTMKDHKLVDGKNLSGKGRLTEAWINKMQIYYSGAIRNNPKSLSGMMREIWAIWYHIGSSDRNPQHQLCPAGSNSWCKYRRAQASGDLQNFHDSTGLPLVVMQAIKPVFVKMTDWKLLKRCLGGNTQNSNESFNNVLWRLCPKTVFVGLSTLKLAACIATVKFNDGMAGVLKIMERVGTIPGKNAVDLAKEIDSDRLYAAQKKTDEIHKESRIAYRRMRTEQEEEAVERDGEMYEAGAY